MSTTPLRNVLVYHLCFPKGKGYVGVTTNLPYRLAQHAISSLTVGRAIRKYGIGRLRVEILSRVESRDEAYEIEKREIEQRGTLHPDGYNLVEGGLGGRKASDITRRRMSKAHLGMKMPPGTGEKISKSKRGKKRRPFSEKHLKRLSEARRKWWAKIPQEERRRITAPALTVMNGS